MSTVRLREGIAECLSEARSDSHEVQQKALQTLASITKSIADMETIYHLNSIILSPSSPESSKFASSLVCSLAMLDKNKAKFGVAGTIPLLVNAVSGPRNPAAHHLLSSLTELVQFHGNCTVAVRAGAVLVLIQVITSTEGEDLAGTSLAVLGLLARFDEGLNALKKTDQAVCSMVDVLKGRCMLSKEVRGSARAREKAGQLLKKMMEVDLDSYSDGNDMFF
ncbi:hypothetical protein CRYUN_Cryun02cG0096300 [Craigia yunnanensis]